jgi:alkanesulfonate monooxygenase SsuD/methylene tetrahydromethanopterin reductase-like flavin-dependent oxidoreductase (luciferase family)
LGSNVSVPGACAVSSSASKSALAAVTSRIRLATLATAVGYRNPAHLAKIAASVDLISRARLTLGIGAGFFEEEYRQYGWEFPPRPATRIRQMEEAVQLILKMWTKPRTTLHGRYFHVEDAILKPKAGAKAAVAGKFAGGGEQMTLCTVARLAEACNIVDGDIAEVRHRLCGAARTLRCGRSRLRHDRKDSCAALGTCPRPRCGGGEARAAGCPRTAPRLCRDGIRGHRPDRSIPGRRPRSADFCRSAERR